MLVFIKHILSAGDRKEMYRFYLLKDSLLGGINKNKDNYNK